MRVRYLFASGIVQSSRDNSCEIHASSTESFALPGEQDLRSILGKYALCPFWFVRDKLAQFVAIRSDLMEVEDALQFRSSGQVRGPSHN